jgi:hypothetical protein
MKRAILLALFAPLLSLGLGLSADAFVHHKMQARGGAFANTESLAFDGSADYLVVPTGSLLDITGAPNSREITWGIWARTASTAGGNLLSRYASSCGAFDYALGYNPTTGTNEFYAGAGCTPSNGPVAATGAWHLFLGRVKDEAGTKTYRISIDGQAFTSPVSAGANVGTVRWIFGCGWTSVAEAAVSGCLHGNMDEIFVFGVGLTDAEGAEAYNSGAPGDLRRHSQRSNLKHWWRGDGDTLPTVRDWIGTAHATAVGDVAKSSNVPLANTASLTFDGTGDYVVLPTGAMSDMEGSLSANERTVSIWAKVPTDAAGNTAHVGQYDGAGGALHNVQWLQYRYGTGNHAALYPGMNATLIDATGAAPTGAWYHMLGTVRNEAGTYKGRLFVNGAEVGTAVNVTGSTWDAVVAWLFGCWWTDSTMSATTACLNGSLDEIAMFDAGFTAAEVTEIYNRGKPGNPRGHSKASSLKHWWRMGDGDVLPTIRDQVGAAHGTAVGNTALSTDVP